MENTAYSSEVKPNITSHITKGVIIGLVLVVIAIAAYFTGQQNSTWNKWAGNIVLIGGVIWACISYGKQMNNHVTFGNVFAHGFKTTIVATLISLVFSIIFLAIFPEMKEQGIEMARQELESQGKMTDDQIDTALDISRKYFWPIMIGGVLLGSLFMGVIGSLIGAAVTKKTPASPFSNQA